jgi:hypothetical protein
MCTEDVESLLPAVLLNYYNLGSMIVLNGSVFQKDNSVIVDSTMLLATLSKN